MSDSRTKLVRQKMAFHGRFHARPWEGEQLLHQLSADDLDGRGACLLGKVLLAQINAEAEKRGVKIDAIGGMRMGADPTSLTVAMASHLEGELPGLQDFVEREGGTVAFVAVFVDRQEEAGGRRSKRLDTRLSRCLPGMN